MAFSESAVSWHVNDPQFGSAVVQWAGEPA